MEPEPQTLWPLALLRTMEERQGESLFILSLTLPGVTLHYSDSGVDDDTIGSIEPMIARWPILDYGIHPFEYRLPLPAFDVEIEDPEGTLGAILTGTDAIGTYRAAAQIRTGVTGLHSSLWGSIFEGIIGDWTVPRRNVVKLILRHDYDWLRQPILKHRILSTDWPYAHEYALGELIPVNVGTFDSRLDNGLSALPTLFVDTRAGEWRSLIQLGNCYDFFDVYVDGVIADPLTDYTFEFAVRNGLQYTAIKHLVDPGPDPDVVVDVTGLESVGDGSGAPFETPAAQLQHLLVNFAHGNWRSWAWLPAASAPLDLGSFAEADDFLQANRHRSRGTFSLNQWTTGRRTARAISTGILGIDLVNEWCLAFGAKPYWTEGGKLAIGVLDHRWTRVFLDGPHWIRDEDMTGDGAIQIPNARRTRDEMETPPLSVKDPEAGWNSKEPIVSPWTRQAISEADLAPYDTSDEPVPWNIVPATLGEPHEVIAESPYAPDDDLAYAEWDDASAVGTFRVRAQWADGGPAVPAGTVLKLLINWRAKYTANGGGTHTMKVGVWVNGAPFYGTEQVLTEDWTDYTDEWELNPSTTAAWTMDELAVTEFAVSAEHTASQDKPAITLLAPRIQYSGGGAAHVLVKERLSRELLLARRPPRITIVDVNPHRAAIRACDPVSISSDAVQAPGGLGWGVETWERRLHFMLSRRFDLTAGKATLRLIDARDLLVPLWEIEVASAPPPDAPGVVRLGAWQAGHAGRADGRRFSRPTDPTDGSPTGVATVDHPSGTGTVTLQQDLEKYNDIGLLLEVGDTTYSPDILKFVFRHDQQPWPIEGGTAVFSFIVP